MNAIARKSKASSAQLVVRMAILCAASFGTHGANAQAMFKPFSADQVHMMRNKTTTGKIYASENAVRTEGQEKGKFSINIMRFDRKVMWILMPDQKTYLEMPWATRAELAAPADGAQIKREPLGSEEVGSYHCDKSRVTVAYKGTTSVQLEWAAKELDGFVVKRQDEKGTWATEYQNVKLGPQDPLLFELPAGYQKLSMGGLGGLQKPQN
jgi:Domain of unknown function (DUF4412)